MSLLLSSDAPADQPRSSVGGCEVCGKPGMEMAIRRPLGRVTLRLSGSLNLGPCIPGAFVFDAGMEQRRGVGT
jgi:hypothetical protein